MEIERGLFIFKALIWFSYLADKVKPFKDLWFIGDNFVNQNFHALPALKTQAQMKHRQIPYVYDEYAVRSFTSNPTSVSSTRSTPAKLVNCVIKALNENHKILRFIIVREYRATMA